MERAADTIAALRKAIATHELPDKGAVAALGHACADTVLQGGVRQGALHEVYAGDVTQGAAATGFASGFAARLGGGKALFWITTDYAVLEYGALNANGLVELGLDPDRVILLRLAKGEDALRAASDILSCGAAGALVLEFARDFRALDFTASRRLSLASARKDIAAIVLRLGGKPQSSAAETRWLVQGTNSEPPGDEEDWGAPQLNVRLIRNRHGELGDWRMGWDCNNGFFEDGKDRGQAADTVSLAAASADRPADAQGKVRRAV